MKWRQMRRNMIQMEGEQSLAADLCSSRLSLLGLFFMAAFLIIGLRAIDLGVIQGDVMRLGENPEAPQEMAQQQESFRRGNIYDRNGILLASTVRAPSLYADPKMILEPEAVAHDLVKMFPELNYANVLKGLSGKGRFVWVKRGITPAQQKMVLTLGQPGLAFAQENRRLYPLGAAAAHLIGYADLDGRGLSGIERSYDEELSAGKDITLSLDIRLQHAVKRETQKAMDDFNGIAGTGIIMDAQTGEILAGVSLPDFDLNASNIIAGHPEKNKELLFNRLTLGVYELGSMFKIFSTAAFFETRKNAMSQAFDVRKPIKIGRFSIDDFKGKKRILSVPEVFIFSSNIGTATMGRMVGGEFLRGFYKDLGLLDTMVTDIREVGKPKSPAVPWKEVSILTASYGHGLSTTPLQMASAVAGIVNGGFKITPRLVAMQKEDHSKSKVRLVSPETSDAMRKLLRLTVTQGTGSKAEVPGYVIGGKTGTAEKIINGRYEHKKLISSFVSAFPMDNPKYVVMVMIDEPKPNEHSHGYATAGWVAAPAVSRIVTTMASIMGLPGDMRDDQKDVGSDLMAYIQEPYEKTSKTAEASKKDVKSAVKPEGVRHVSY
jgi:cell division protein FtsI (penicillin-binding protein 3)